MLGVGDWQFFVQDRSGTPLGQLHSVTSAAISWERDDFGECNLRLANPVKSSVDLINDVRTVRHEIAAFRDGELVWEGPITRLGWYTDSIEIDAKDVSWYLTRRALEYGYDYSGQSVSTVSVVFDHLRLHYPAVGDPFRIGEYLAKVETVSDARTAAKVVPYEATLYDWLQEYADNGGLDYVLRGRSIIVKDTHTVVEELPLLTTDHFMGGTPSIIEYGAELATRAIVLRKNNTVSIGSAPQEWLDYYGTIDTVENNNREEDEGQEADDAVDDQIDRTLTDSYPAPIEILVPANVALRPDVVYDFHQLMPGVHAKVEARAQGKVVTRQQRIDSLKVNWDAGGEQVQVTLIQAPATTVYAT